MTLRCFRRRPFLPALILLQAVVLLPFRFTTELGERDSYRMFLGLADTVKRGAFFNSPLLYNREASFGYYGFLYSLLPAIGPKPVAMIEAMNWIGIISVVLFTVPNYCVTERLFGEEVAIASGLILIATPVWWHCGLYGHPVTTALLLFFTGLAIVCRNSTSIRFPIRAAAIAFFTVALTFRLDIGLLFVALVAMLWYVRQGPFINALKESIPYILTPVVLFGIAAHFLPTINYGTAPASIVDLLERFEQTSNLHESLRDFVGAVVQAFTPVLLAACPVATWILMRKRERALTIFVSGEIAVNLAVFLLDSRPPRHFIVIAPAVSISGALVLVAFLSRRLPKRSLYPSILCGSAVAATVVLTSLGLGYGSGYLSYFHSQFLDRFTVQTETGQANKVASGLIDLPALGTPVVVLCDSTLVIAEMEKRSPNISINYRVVRNGPLFIGVHEVDEGQNRFIMVEQSWEQDIVNAFDQLGLYPGVPVLSAPFLSLTYQGPRAVLKA